MKNNTLSHSVISNSEIILDNTEVYDASQIDCYPFRRGGDIVNGHRLALGNMVSGYPFTLYGIRFENSEAAYIAGAFSNDIPLHIEIQEALRTETNGFMAKKKIRRANEAVKRTDWEEFNIQWMLYVVWCKVVGNVDFRRMLLDIPSTAVIIEDSTFQNGATATVWGMKNDCLRQASRKYTCKLKAEGRSDTAIDRACDQKRLNEWRTQGIFRGKNLMGKILMLCRDAALRGCVPPIDLELLRSRNISLLGLRLTFDSIPQIEVKEAVATDEIILDREEVYNPKELNVWCFKHVDDIVEGVKLDLCNMTSCYPFEVEGTKWRSSEELYLCGEFSNDTEEHRAIQEELRSAKSPYAAKRFIKGKHKSKVREDFAEFRTQWMLWVVWQKCNGNADFRRKLLSLPDDVTLVEDTTTDTGGSGQIWGCSNRELVEARKVREKQINSEYQHLTKNNSDFIRNIELNSIRNIGFFVGQNNIGKILMLCRRSIKEGAEPRIDIDLLRSKNIHILGKQLTFNR